MILGKSDYANYVKMLWSQRMLILYDGLHVARVKQEEATHGETQSI